jgi:catechol 2,3-dioxygenase-like lactoylglutathione lyase family enzyme
MTDRGLPPDWPRTGLDHVGAIALDLDAAARRWERLGFRLSPVSRQRGRLPGRDEAGAWGTANRCAIFGQGYLELIGVVDAAGFNPWTRFLERFEGLHLLALRVPSADDAWAAYTRVASFAARFDAPVQRARALDVDGVERTMGFRNIFSRDAACPEGRYIVIEHQTPDYLWQPRYLSHPNGALALDVVYLCCAEEPDDPAAPGQTPMGRIAALTGSAGRPAAPGWRRFDAPSGGHIECGTPAAFEARWGLPAPAQPSLAGVAVRFADRVHAARCMAQNGVAVVRRGDAWHVAPDATGGFLINLVQ